ncbi:hypothetical protein F5Y00DRAFT_271888 [Daldinia vernicosa]|uniref:uncharacterized protein n=1 Tax=Daldinia vernicosa TaxID=114800 RepID=UPI0020089503|nr:uncharacterized protein F5Y00DRAFT_271888 [Daldinia vernicosa]KAI0846594.1 hypothetical protein F5Y00DRAFT_271888 [Daldinia vernicosa]
MTEKKDSLEISQLPPVAVPGPDLSHDVQDDKPELHPDSIDPATSGRRVLLRHQRVLLAPVTPAPTTITATQSSEEKSQVNGRSTAGSRMSLKMERVKDAWADLKRRVTPQQYPRAWLLFLAIITIAAGAIIVVLRVAGWCGIAMEAVHHLELANEATAVYMTESPAPPNLVVGGGVSVTGRGTGGDLLSLKPTGFNAEMMVGAAAPGTGGRDVVSDLPAGSTPTHELTAKTALARDRTVYITVTAPPESTSTTSTTPGSPSTSSEGTGTSASSILSHGTAPTISMTTAPSSASATTTTTSTSTEEPDIYCPHSERPLVWTPCVDHPTSDASHGVASPFLSVCHVLVALWKTATSYGSNK